MNAYLLLPELGEATEGYYVAFKVVMLLVLILKFLSVLMKIFEQTSMDVFLVDFEPQNQDSKQVNGWRYLFIANEFVELQSEMRYVQPETTFIWFAFFWVGLGWQYVVLATPVTAQYNDTPVLDHDPVLKFFLVAILFFGIGAVQFIMGNFNNYAYGSEINKFKDLCTFANISIIMLDEHASGYYLHGKVPWSTSDIPLDWLQKEL